MTGWFTCWYAELRKAVLSPVVPLSAAGAALLAVVMDLYGFRHAHRHFEDGAPATYVDEPAGALWAAAQHSGTFVGLVVAGALAGALYAVECESGMWPSLLAARPGRARLLAVKAAVALLLTTAFTVVLAVVLFAVGRAAAGVTGFATSDGPGWGRPRRPWPGPWWSRPSSSRSRSRRPPSPAGPSGRWRALSGR
ncbi:hypothetical protein [Streptomyces sudanensis]|uniref:hypothetical protein n=1 Tax=Streptomyces sudanensis TaxID=436397 RepID=UPI0020CE28A9|nr:hypothetical protein [Streptomyces sudanensis]MCP9958868.1 hypothetical protein [Streptomyces sudanensis]MCQ0000655.1 hypothetical protein [Streptomyces sudanensis]